jgi:hypothetical protein
MPFKKRTHHGRKAQGATMSLASDKLRLLADALNMMVSLLVVARKTAALRPLVRMVANDVLTEIIYQTVDIDEARLLHAADALCGMGNAFLSGKEPDFRYTPENVRAMIDALRVGA